MYLRASMFLEMCKKKRSKSLPIYSNRPQECVGALDVGFSSYIFSFGGLFSFASLF